MGIGDWAQSPIPIFYNKNYYIFVYLIKGNIFNINYIFKYIVLNT